MSDTIRGRRWRSVALSLVLGTIVIGLGALPALAAGTSFTATYPDEKTTFHPCPPALSGDICFTGVGHGPTTVGTTTLNGTEEYAGFVDPKSPGTIPGCPADHNAVAIRTSSGTLFLTTSGSACGSFDAGTWQAFGGTGIFEGAMGSGTVRTIVDPVRNPDGSVHSSSTYVGTLNLHRD